MCINPFLCQFYSDGLFYSLLNNNYIGQGWKQSEVVLFNLKALFTFLSGTEDNEKKEQKTLF